jgi:hypothetical protein
MAFMVTMLSGPRFEELRGQIGALTGLPLRSTKGRAEVLSRVRRADFDFGSSFGKNRELDSFELSRGRQVLFSAILNGKEPASATDLKGFWAAIRQLPITVGLAKTTLDGVYEQ